MAALRVVEPEEPADRELIDRTLAGDRDAFGTIVERYQRRIYRVACAILRDSMDADVVTQDTFVQAYTRLSTFEGRCSLETWLTRIAINRSRDALRARKGTVADLDAPEVRLRSADERPDAEREAISRQLNAAIERAVASLSAQQKLIFRLRHYEDMSLEDIAASLGVRSGTVRAHLFRAVHKVRAELAAWFPATADRTGR